MVNVKSFKVGDRVRYADRGAVAWEDNDWLAEAGVLVGDIRVVEKVCEGSLAAVRLVDTSYWHHPNHFELVTD
jgi:hypothetical protein